MSFRGTRNAYRIILGKTSGKWPLQALKKGWENDIKMDMPAFFNILPNASLQSSSKFLPHNPEFN
jgi:hypothetical protein